MDSRDIPEVLKQLRAKLGLTQEELAARLDVAFTTLNRWENGRTTPRGKAKQAISEPPRLQGGASKGKSQT